LSVDFGTSTVSTQGRTVRVRAFPASINPEEVLTVQASERVAAARGRIAAEAKEFNVIRVDRLDPSKNQALGFTAFGRLLEAHPELRGRVRFHAFLIPSRTDLTVYREYHDAVYAEIARVNGMYAEECGFEPIHVYYTNDRAQAFAAMEACDALLVNSREDGMNLVVKEWAVLSRKPGVLVVSETAGVAAEAGESALQVSPLDVEGTAIALATALGMALEERTARLDTLRGVFTKWTARDWLGSQLAELGLDAPAPLEDAGTGELAAGSVVEREVTVLNRDGLHARPAAAFVRCARGFSSEIEILKDDHAYSAISILDVLTANLRHGAKFSLRASGPDAEDAVKQLSELLHEFQRQDA
jgi:phosphotransferase system HPr (HPr) family protein